MTISPPEDTVAVVLTHRRRRLATDVVRQLIDGEGFAAGRVVLVVDGEGGLEDLRLEESITVERLAAGAGPAGGFRRGMELAFADPTTQWVYLCEDDVGLLGLPGPRIQSALAAVDAHETTTGEQVGAVVAYGRRFGKRAGVTDPFLPSPAGERLQPVDVAAWGATLVSRRVHERGIRPDDWWFFGYEDFDFFLTMRRAGMSLLVDRDAALATAAATSTSAGRLAALSDDRPDDAAEAWRAYYVARNLFELARRHGDARWLAWHLAYSARRWQLAASREERSAVLAGLRDGLRRRSGRNDRYVRTVGEWGAARPEDQPARAAVNASGATSTSGGERSE